VNHWPHQHEPIFQAISVNHNAKAFRFALDYACQLDGLVYMVEDDYIHRHGAAQVLEEGVQGLGGVFDYVSTYDHPDKMPPTSFTRLHLGKWCHWRESVLTTATFAVDAETLRQDRKIWEYFSTDECGWVRDHLAFSEITKKRTLATTVPAFSTHCESEWLAPLVDWAEVNCQ